MLAVVFCANVPADTNMHTRKTHTNLMSLDDKLPANAEILNSWDVSFMPSAQMSFVGAEAPDRTVSLLIIYSSIQTVLSVP